MRRISKSKVALSFGIIVILLLVTLVGVVVQQNSRIQEIKSSDEHQAEQLKTLSKRIGDYTYNPQTLNECMNNAANEYSNAIKTGGEVIVEPDKSKSYSLSSEDWRKADEKLKTAESYCKSQFGK